MNDLSKMSVEDLVRDFKECVLSEQLLGTNCSKSMAAIISELERRTAGCAFCADCDATRTDPGIRQLLFKIAEQAGKRNWWNAMTYIGQLYTRALGHMHEDINAALAAKGVSNG